MQLDATIADCVPEFGPLASYLRWAVKTTDAEHLFHLGAILPCLANECVEAGFRVEPRRMLVPAVWTFLVGVAASSKSTAKKRAERTYLTYLARRAAGSQVRDPFIIAEGSIPGIFEALAERFDPDLGMSSGVVVRDEAARLLGDRDASIADMLCNIIDGEEVKRHLRSLRAEQRAGGTVRDALRHPAFSGCFATTFARLKEVTTASYIEGGLYSRFLWFRGQPGLPNPVLEVDTYPDEQARVVDEWLDWGQWMLAHTLLPPAERVVAFEPGCVEILRSTLFETFKGFAGTDNRLNATRKRGLTQAVVVAGIYALSQRRLVATEDDMIRAVNLVTVCTEGLEALDKVLVVPEEQSDVQAVYDVITAGAPGYVTRAEIMRHLNFSRRRLDMALETLECEETVARVSLRGTRPGRPTDGFTIASKRGPLGQRKHQLRVVPPPEDAPDADAEAGSK